MKYFLGALFVVGVLFMNSCAKKMNIESDESPTSDQENRLTETAPTSCSPQIVFISDRNGSGNLFSYNPFSLETKPFAITDSAISEVVYNAYTKSVIFSQPDINQNTLYSKELLSPHVRLLMESPAEEIPAWSPANNKIAYSRKESIEKYSLVVQDLTTQDISVVFENALQSYEPNWSPDGKQIAFTLTDSTHNADIILINADGTDVRNLTSSQKVEGNPSWSPDGKKLLFYRMMNNSANLYEFIIETAELIPLTYGAGNQLSGKYSNDGNYIVYVGEVDGNWDLFMMNSDGNNKSQLTFNPGFDGHPIWVPCE